MWHCIILIVFLINAVSYFQDANTPTSHALIPESGTDDSKEIENLDKQILELKNKITDLEGSMLNSKAEMERKIQQESQLSQDALQSVNTSISGVHLLLSVVGIIIAFVGITFTILGYTIIQRADRTRQDVEDSLNICQKIKDETSSLNTQIQSNISGLYEKLRFAELEYIMNRLQRVPLDIVNLFTRLASQDIPSHLYLKFKEAYLSISEPSPHPTAPGKYRLLFYQQFPKQSLFDKEISKDLEQDYGNILDCAFNHEIEVSSVSFFAECAIQGFSTHSERICEYYKALYNRLHPHGGIKDEFTRSEKLHSMIYNSLDNKVHRFALVEILIVEPIPIITDLYTKMLLRDYESLPDNTPEQSELIKKIRSMSKQES